MSGSLRIVPMPFITAKAFVEQHHRHHKAPPFSHFSVGATREPGDYNEEDIVAVAIVARPVSRMLCDGYTAEVVRLCSIDPPQTNGHASGACSMLYAACWRAACALGWRRLITYTLPEEGGASLRAVGWTCHGPAGGGSWNRPGRERTDRAPMSVKMRWEISRDQAAR